MQLLVDQDARQTDADEHLEYGSRPERAQLLDCEQSFRKDVFLCHVGAFLVYVLRGDADLGHASGTARVHHDHEVLQRRLFGAGDRHVGVSRVLAQEI